MFVWWISVKVVKLFASEKRELITLSTQLIQL